MKGRNANPKLTVILLPFLAGEVGFEPTLTDSESAVLPLDYSPAHQDYSYEHELCQNYLIHATHHFNTG